MRRVGIEGGAKRCPGLSALQVKKRCRTDSGRAGGAARRHARTHFAARWSMKLVKKGVAGPGAARPRAACRGAGGLLARRRGAAACHCCCRRCASRRRRRVVVVRAHHPRRCRGAAAGRGRDRIGALEQRQNFRDRGRCAGPWRAGSRRQPAQPSGSTGGLGTGGPGTGGQPPEAGMTWRAGQNQPTNRKQNVAGGPCAKSARPAQGGMQRRFGGVPGDQTGPGRR